MRDPHVLDGVVGVDLEVAPGLHRQRQPAVAGDLLEHVVEERQAGPDRRPAARPGASETATSVSLVLRAIRPSGPASSASARRASRYAAPSLGSSCRLRAAGRRPTAASDAARASTRICTARQCPSQPLGAGQRLDRRRHRGQRPGREVEHAHAPPEGGDRERRGEAGRAGGREHVARAGQVVAHRLGGGAAHEDGAGARDPRHQSRGPRPRGAPGARARTRRRAGAPRRGLRVTTSAAPVRDGAGRDLPARQVLELALHLGLHRGGQRAPRA